MSCPLSKIFGSKKEFSFTALQNERFSCRKFSEEQIEKNIIEKIIYDASLSPSSLALEPWQFFVLSKAEDKEKFSEICLKQEHVKTCSHIVIICARTDLKSEDEFLQKMVERKRLDMERFKANLEKFGKIFDNMSQDELYNYAAQQCYLACANLVNSAASREVDSCIIGGFSKEEANKFLKLEEKVKSVIVIALGKKACDISPKTRRKLEDVLTYK